MLILLVELFFAACFAIFIIGMIVGLIALIIGLIHEAILNLAKDLRRLRGRS